MSRELKALLAELVSIDTTSTRPNAPLIERLEARLAPAGFALERVPFRDPQGTEKVNLLARRGPPGLPELALVGHTDCVPFDPAWAEALQLTERDGKLYGRGACDTKAFVACTVSAALRTPASRPLLLAFTADEELGCAGAKVLAEAGKIAARRAIAGEPTSLTPVRGHKGYSLAEIEVLGKEGHSAHPDTGASAVFRAARLIRKLEAHALGPLRQERDAHYDPPFPTLNVGLISGGRAKNVIAGACRFTLEWRPLPGRPERVIRETVDRLVAECRAEEPGFEAKVHWTRGDPGVETPLSASIVQFLVEESGKAPSTVPFGTEAPQLAELGAEAVVFGPGDIRVAHQTGEHVPIEELVRCEEILSRAIARFCG